MKRFLKYLGITVGTLLLLIIALAIALPFLIDPNQYKPQISEAVKTQTGRELTLEGDITLSIFPWIGLDIGKTELSNAPGFGDEPFLKVEKVEVKVKLIPLLRKQIRVKKIQLKGLWLNLARDQQGRNNWDDMAQTAKPITEDKKEEKVETAEEEMLEIESLTIGGLDVQDGEIHWRDDKNKTEYHIRNLNLQSGAIESAKPVELTLGFDVESGNPPIKTRVDLDGDVLFDPDTQTLQIKKLTLNIAGLSLTTSLEGKNIMDAPEFSGHLKVAEFNPKAFMKNLGLAYTPQDGAALSRVSLETRFSASDKQVSLKNLRVRIDDSLIQGKLSTQYESTSSYRFDLTLDQFDLDRYLPVVTPEKNAPSKAVKKSAPTEKFIIPVKMLRELDVQGVFQLNKLKAFGIRSSNIAIRLNASKGAIKLGPNQASLYKGRYQGTVHMDIGKGAPRFRLNNTLTGVEVGPLLKDAGIFDKFSGQGNVSAKLTARGIDADSILKTLNGNVRFKLKNGQIKGLDLYKMVQDAKRAYQQAQGKPVKTKAQVNEQMEFTHISGSVKIKNGIASNQDLKLSGPYLGVRGKGTANLPRQQINYHLQVTVSEERGKSGTTVPVRVSGKLMDPSFSIEWQKILEKAIKREIDKKVEQEKKRLKRDLEKKLQDELRKRLGF